MASFSKEVKKQKLADAAATGLKAATMGGALDYARKSSTPITTQARTPLGDYTRVSNNYYTGGNGQPWSMNWAGLDNDVAGLHAGSYGNPSAPNYFGTAFLPGAGYESVGKYVPDFNKDINTPVGNLNFESNYDIPNTIDATFTPNAKTNYYLQALASLLRR